MSGRSILGLVALNLLFTGVGVCLLFGLRGWRSWAELLRLSGFAYLLGVAATGVVWVIELVLGVNLSLATILVTAVLLGGVGTLSGLLLGRRLPPRTLSLPRISPLTALFGALAVVYAEALFRSGRLSGLYEFDGWAFWVPKGEAIYFFGGLDEQFFRDLPGPSYPPLIPALEAAAFHFMGSTDVVTLHLQFWFLLVGFVAAVAGLLTTRVPPLILWPPVLLVLVSPHVVTYALQAQGDFLLDELIAVAALLVALWLVERERWQLVAGGLIAAGAMLTKREGYLLGAVLLVSALVASSRDVRRTWPPLLLAGLAALVATIPWRVFLAVRDLSGGGPEAGGAGLFSHADRAWPSLRLSLSALFDFDIWLLAIPLALVAIIAAFASGARQLSGYCLLVCGLSVAGFTWVIWSFPSLPITKNAALNPIVRLSGSLVFALSALVPLLLAAAWRAAPAGDRR
jgi:hypothetical protein